MNNNKEIKSILEIVTNEIRIKDNEEYFKKSGYIEISNKINEIFMIINKLMLVKFNNFIGLSIGEFMKDYSVVTKSYYMNIKNYIIDKCTSNDEIYFIEDIL